MVDIKFTQWIINLNRSKKKAILIVLDAILIPLILWLSFSIKIGGIYSILPQDILFFLAAPFIAIPIFIRFGLYRAILRYIGLQALWAVLQAVTLYAVLWAVLAGALAEISTSIALLNGLLAMLFIGGSRMAGRWLITSSNRNGQYSGTDKISNNVVIYGAGSAGMQLAVALSAGNELNPIAFIDENKHIQKMQINGIHVYAFTSLSQLITKYGVKEVLLAIPSATKKQRKKVITLLEPYPIHVRTIPDFSELAQGRIDANDIREIDISDLLGRERVDPDNELLRANITKKNILVTGAGGSIGSELCRQIINNRPNKLILFEMSEFQLYSIERELNQLVSNIEIVPILGSVVDEKRMIDVCKAFRIHTIYHAAAYKHVPMVEKNPGEAIRNNVMGTLSAAKAAIKSNVNTFVLISTDKAVRPTNTMGATKRFAELVLQALSQDKKLYKRTRFTMVRFGNVLGSSGSVVPLFREQIANGGPVTVTDSKIIRYFMTIPEAAELVIQAGALGQGGDVFVLDMGDPIHIIDLAKRMIRLSGYDLLDKSTPEGDIEITITGLRPGEKLYEELLIGDNVSVTQHRKIMSAKEEVVPWDELVILIQQLEQNCEKGDYKAVRKVLQSAVSGFIPQCDVVDEISLALIKVNEEHINNVISING